MTGTSTLSLSALACGVVAGLLAVPASASCITSAAAGSDVTHTSDTAAADSLTCWRPESGEPDVVERRSRITVSHYSIGHLMEVMRREGFRSGQPLTVALDNVRRDLIENGVSDAVYIHPSDDCQLYIPGADGRPDVTRPVAAMWWPEAEGGCRELKELIGVAVADHMDGVVIETRAAAEYREGGRLTDVSFEPSPISFAWLFVTYHDIDVSALPVEFGFVNRLAERLRTVSLPYRVQERDTLSHLALALTGNPGNYRLLHALNRDSVPNADEIVSGETIVMPPSVAHWAAVSSGEGPTAISLAFYGTPIFASTVAGLCGVEPVRAGQRCSLPVWRDSVSVANALGDPTVMQSEHIGDSRLWIMQGE